MKELEGNIAIVTGGARGIGEGICKVFSGEGATVFSWDILDEGELTAKKINEDGGDIFYQKVDITSESQVNKATDFIILVPQPE